MHKTKPNLSRSPKHSVTDPDLEPDEDTAARTADNPEEVSNGFTGLRDDLSALVDDARTYAETEIIFQKTRAGLAGKAAARALLLLVLAGVLLHIALIALAVGAVIALAPLVTIWGAIAIVVGMLLIGVAALLVGALGDGKAILAMFGADEGV